MSPRQRRLLPWFALAVIYVVWGSTYMAISILVKELPPFATASLRFLLAGLVMAGLAALRPGSRVPDAAQWRDYGIVGALLLGGGNAMVMWAEKAVPSGIAALIVATVPLWITLLDGLRPGGRPWTGRVWAGVALGLGGVALIVRPEGQVSGPVWLGIAGLQVGAVCWTVGTLYAQSIPPARRLGVLEAAAVEMLVGAVVLTGESLLFGESFGGFARASTAAWLAFAYLVAFGSVVAFTAFAYCLEHLPASTVGTYAYVNPVVAVTLGALFLHEPVSPGLVAGAVLILGAVLLTASRPPSVREARSPEPASPAARTPSSPRLVAETQ